MAPSSNSMQLLKMTALSGQPGSPAQADTSHRLPHTGTASKLPMSRAGRSGAEST